MIVKQLRKITGLTQKEFSTKYKIPLKTLQNWEAKEDSPSYRSCPFYVHFLLEEAVKRDFSNLKTFIESNIDEQHTEAIIIAKDKISKSNLSKFVKDVLLYGSTARGQAKTESDVDILLVLDEKIKSKAKYNNWITYLKGNISSYDFNIPEADLHIVYGDSWKLKNDAYFCNVLKEGFSIWN